MLSSRQRGASAAGCRSERSNLRPAAVGMLIGGLFAGCWMVVDRAYSQMASTGATDQPLRPLPKDKKLPVIDFRDIAHDAGLLGVVISGEEEQTYVVENTGTGVALFDYDNDGLLDIFVVNAGRLDSKAPLLTPFCTTTWGICDLKM